MMMASNKRSASADAEIRLSDREDYGDDDSCLSDRFSDLSETLYNLNFSPLPPELLSVSPSLAWEILQVIQRLLEQGIVGGSGVRGGHDAQAQAEIEALTSQSCRANKDVAVQQQLVEKWKAKSVALEKETSALQHRIDEERRDSRKFKDKKTEEKTVSERLAVVNSQALAHLRNELKLLSFSFSLFHLPTLQAKRL
eukprot:TRINITY_DN160450_c0_g1_i1.p1 TRINITY_DN160450_c0_g1~~TRINITY_DN160450_c0_g1_i1.p1  ORF type:complete len:206 (-),score=35.94 TRINITY_DN160450_c0_g1_i1:62-652(-)